MLHNYATDKCGSALIAAFLFPFYLDLIPYLIH